MFGMTMTIVGGVSVLYREAKGLSAYKWYLILEYILYLLMFPCWALILSPPCIFCIYVVWSAEEEINVESFPELMGTSAALKYAYSPEVVYKEGQELPGEMPIGIPAIP